MSRVTQLKELTDGVVELAAVVTIGFAAMQGVTDPAVVFAIAGIAGYSRKVRGGE